MHETPVETPRRLLRLSEARNPLRPPHATQVERLLCLPEAASQRHPSGPRNALSVNVNRTLSQTMLRTMLVEREGQARAVQDAIQAEREGLTEASPIPDASVAWDEKDQRVL